MSEEREDQIKPKAAQSEPDSAAMESPKEPSPNQPKLDRLLALIRENIAEDAIEDAYINELDRDLPTVVVSPKRWVETSALLKNHPELGFAYLRNLSGVDHETHMEVVYHLLSMDRKEDCCIKVKTDRENPSVPSVAPVWPTANWNEREVYDLLGIDFPGHPDLSRIMMPDDWVGHPLRKDYEPHDPEV